MPTDAERCTILVVDDDPDMLAATCRQLERAGYRVARASGGAQALQMVQRERPLVVLLDVVMDDLDGVEVCRRIKLGHPDGPPLVVLASNKRTAPADRVRGFSLGADAYIARPITGAELVAQVEALERLALAFRRQEQRGRDDPEAALTQREREICSLVLMGHQTKEISSLLHLSVHTVHTHRKRIRRKLGVKQRASLAQHLRRV